MFLLRNKRKYQNCHKTSPYLELWLCVYWVGSDVSGLTTSASIWLIKTYIWIYAILYQLISLHGSEVWSEHV